MKIHLFFLTMIVPISALQGQPAVIATSDYNLPKTNFRELLNITAKIARKPVVVTNEEVLKIQSSLVLPAPVAFEDARKAIAALLMLEGFELVEAGDELHLRRFLTEKQVVAVNEAIGRVRPGVPERESRARVVPGGSRAKKEWILIRPEEQKQDGEKEVKPEE